MKAFTYKSYGNPEVLELSEVEKPQPKDHEIVIKVSAISINPAEWHLLRGSIWMVRLAAGIFKPKNPILGGDIAGEVEAVGQKVTAFQIGDKVFGRSYGGALAEFACLEEKHAAKIDDNCSFEVAASLPLATATALNSLRDKGNIQPGQKVLINGASGGIGTFAVQLAKYYGAEVTGVCSTRNVDLIKSLGAEHVVNYTKEDFTTTGSQYDLIIDLVGNRSISEVNRVLKPKGTCVFVGYSGFKNILGYFIIGAWLSKTTQKDFIVVDTKIKNQDLQFIMELIKRKKIIPILNSQFSFEDTTKAFEHLGTRRTTGKIVIKVQ